MNNQDWSECDVAYEHLTKAYDVRDEHLKLDSRAIGEAGVELGFALQKVREQYTRDVEFGRERAKRYPRLNIFDTSRWMLWAEVDEAERMKIYDNGSAMTPHGLLTAYRKVVCHGDKPEPPPRKKSTPRAPAYSGFDVAAEEGLLTTGKTGGSTTKFAARVEKHFPDIEIHNPEHEAQLREACAEMRMGNDAAEKRYERHVEKLAVEAEAQTETLAPTAQDRLESAIRKRNRVLEKAYAQRYWKDVEAQVKKRVDAAMKQEWERIEAVLDSVREEKRRIASIEAAAEAAFNKDPSKIVLIMDRKLFQELIGLIHPDRYPESLRERLNKAVGALNSSKVH